MTEHTVGAHPVTTEPAIFGPVDRALEPMEVQLRRCPAAAGTGQRAIQVPRGMRVPRAIGPLKVHHVRPPVHRRDVRAAPPPGGNQPAPEAELPRPGVNPGLQRAHRAAAVRPGEATIQHPLRRLLPARILRRHHPLQEGVVREAALEAAQADRTEAADRPEGIEGTNHPRKMKV